MNWLQRKARERIPAEVRLDSVPRRNRWLFYAAYPGRALRYFGHRVRKWATLPGDVWMDFQRDQYFVITAVKPRHVEAEVYSGQVWNTPRLMEKATVAPRVRVNATDPLTFWSTVDGHSGAVVEVAWFRREQMEGWLRG